MSGGAVSIVVIASFMLSVLTFVVVQIGGGRSDRLSKLQRCAETLQERDAEVLRLKARIEVLQDENIAMMRKLLANGQN